MTPTGRAVAFLAAAAASALWLPPEISAGLLALVAVLLVGDAWTVRRGPVVARDLPREVVRGAPARFTVTAQTPAGTTVWVRQPQTADVRIEPAEAEGGLVSTVVATRRGRHELGPVVTLSTGPLRLARWSHSHGGLAEIDSHADLPGARRLAAAVRNGTFRDPGLRRGPLGLGTDFETIRDYTPDDDIRRMNWMASERAGRPMVNQYREDTEREVWCVIDAGRLLSAPVADRTRLDVALDAVAAVAAVADVVGDRVGAVVFDSDVQRVVRPRRASAAGLVRLLDDLQPTMVDSDYEAAFGRIANAKRSLVVVFTDILDAAAAEPLLEAVPVLVRRHAVVVAGVIDPDLVASARREPATSRDHHVASVANDLLRERDQVRGRLIGAGAVVVDVAVDRLPSACVAAYLQLKAAARV